MFIFTKDLNKRSVDMNTEYAERSQVMEVAHQLVKKGLNFDHAQKKAWQVEMARKKMIKNIVAIRFYRKDGVLVTKLATLNPAFLPKGKIDILQRENSYLQVTFWSVRDHDYRSFLVQNFVSVDDITSIENLLREQFAAA